VTQTSIIFTLISLTAMIEVISKINKIEMVTFLIIKKQNRANHGGDNLRRGKL